MSRFTRFTEEPSNVLSTCLLTLQVSVLGACY